MHVHPDTILGGIVSQRLQGLVRAPVQVRRGELNAHALLAIPALPEVDEKSQMIFDRDRLGLQIGRNLWCEMRLAGV